MIKFWMNAVLSALFIALHLRVLYMDTKPILKKEEGEVSWLLMYCLLVWFTLLVIDEMVQVWKEKLFYWWQNVWNRLDLIVFLSYLIALILCLSSICEDTTGTCKLSDTGEVECITVDNSTAACRTSSPELVHAGRMIMSVVTVFLFLRLTMFITSDLTLGPIVLMLIEMASTFANFFVIYLVVLVGFGTAYSGLLVEVGTFSLKRNLPGIFYYTYFQSLGELFLEDFQGPGSYYLNDKDSIEDDWYRGSDINGFYYGVALTLLIIFMIVSNLMLLNILIAMFTESYDRISSEQKIIWKFQRYSLLTDYEQKFLPAPLNIIHYPISFFRWWWKSHVNAKKTYDNPLSSGIDKTLRSFVREGLQSFQKSYGEELEDENAEKSRYVKYATGL